MNAQPNVVTKEGTEIWTNAKNQPHRLNGLPAMVYADGTLMWYEHGLRHRDTTVGPAIDSVNADTKQWKKEWFDRGKRHRDDGPAVVRATVDANGSARCEEWWRHGILTKRVCRNQTGEKQKWYQDGHLHRNGGPAMIDFNGTQHWFQQGRRHRDNGPAIIHSDGTESWYQYGRLVRVTTPDQLTWTIHA